MDGADGDNHIGFGSRKPYGALGEVGNRSMRILYSQGNVFAFHVSKLRQPLLKSLQHRTSSQSIGEDGHLVVTRWGIRQRCANRQNPDSQGYNPAPRSQVPVPPYTLHLHLCFILRHGVTPYALGAL